MTDSFVRDDVLEAVLRSRAGDGAPPDLRTSILAAVAADGPRVVSRRGRATGHPWRLLAVAAVLVGTVGTALYLGGTSRQALLTPTPGPSVLAVSPSATPSAPSRITLQSPPPEPTLPSCDQVEAFSTATHAVLGNVWGSSTPSPIGATVRAGSIAAWADHGDGTSDIVLVDPETGTQETLLSLGIARNKYADLEWAPDGSALGIGFGSDVCRGGVLIWTPAQTVLLHASDYGTFDTEQGSIAWSPNSSRMIVTPEGPVNAGNNGTHHWIVPRDGGAVTDLGPPCVRCNSFSHAWSPDGRWIAAQYEQFDALGPANEATVGNTTSMGVAIADARDGTWTTVIPEQTGEALLGWRNDHVALGEQNISENQIRIIEYDALDGSRQVLPYDAVPTFWFLPTTQKFVTLTVTGSGASERDAIRLQEIATGRTTTIWTGPKGVSIAGGVLAPDGSAVALTGGKGDQPTDTWVVRLDGSGATTFPGAIIGETGWQPIAR